MMTATPGFSSGICRDRRRRDLLGRRQPLGHNLLDCLVEWWPLSEPSGTRRGVHGGLHLADNGSTPSSDGVASIAASFNGSTHYLSRGSEAALATGDIDYTVLAWVYVSTTGVFLPFVTKDGVSGNREYSLNATASPNNFRFYAGNGASTLVAQAIETGFSIAANTWYMLVGWHSATDNHIGLAVNAEAPVTTATSGAAGAGAAAAVVGSDDFTPRRYHSGRIQRVGFWKRLLTADERAWLYNGGRGRDYPFV